MALDCTIWTSFIMCRESLLMPRTLLFSIPTYVVFIHSEFSNFVDSHLCVCVCVSLTAVTYVYMYIWDLGIHKICYRQNADYNHLIKPLELLWTIKLYSDIFLFFYTIHRISLECQFCSVISIYECIHFKSVFNQKYMFIIMVILNCIKNNCLLKNIFALKSCRFDLVAQSTINYPVNCLYNECYIIHWQYVVSTRTLF